MKITFSTSPDLKLLLQKEAKTKKLAFTLLKSFYENLKVEVINSLKYQKPMQFDTYKAELISILKLIYLSFYTNYNKLSILNHYTIINNTKNDNSLLIKQTINSIVDSTNENINLEKNNFFNQLAEKQALIIFENIQKKVNSLYEKSINNSYLELKEINNNIRNIEQELQDLQFLPLTKQVITTRNKLEKLLKKLENERQNYSNINDIAMAKLINIYDKQITTNRAISQAENETNLISNRFRAFEYNILTFVISRNSNTNQSPVSEFKEWDSTLDSKTRETHAKVNGQIVNKTEVFLVYNPITNEPEYAQEPMGEGLSIENSANCRCKAKYSVSFELKIQ